MANHRPTRRSTGWILQRGLGVVALSLAANGLVLFAVRTTGVVPVFRPLSWGSVLFLTAIGGLGATLAYGIVNRFATEVDRTFLTLAVVFLVLSVVPDFTLAANFPGATTAGIVVLIAMHVIVAAIAVALFTRL